MEIFYLNGRPIFPLFTIPILVVASRGLVLPVPVPVPSAARVRTAAVVRAFRAFPPAARGAIEAEKERERKFEIRSEHLGVPDKGLRIQHQVMMYHCMVDPMEPRFLISSATSHYFGVYLRNPQSTVRIIRKIRLYHGRTRRDRKSLPTGGVDGDNAGRHGDVGGISDTVVDADDDDALAIIRLRGI